MKQPIRLKRVWVYISFFVLHFRNIKSVVCQYLYELNRQLKMNILLPLHDLQALRLQTTGQIRHILQVMIFLTNPDHLIYGSIHALIHLPDCQFFLKSEKLLLQENLHRSGLSFAVLHLFLQE